MLGGNVNELGDVCAQVLGLFPETIRIIEPTLFQPGVI